MTGRFVPVLFICCVLAFTSCASRGGYTTYKFEPKEFHSLILDRNGTVVSRQITKLAPELSTVHFVEVAWLNLPKRIVINTPDLETLKWEEAKVPMCLVYRLQNDNYQRIYTEHVVFLKNINTDEVLSANVSLNWYDGLQSRDVRILEDGEFARATMVYNITSFIELPKYSAEYEIWVKIADIESDHKRVKIDLKENGRLVTRPEN